jgi:hypothetical protein
MSTNGIRCQVKKFLAPLFALSPRAYGSSIHGFIYSNIIKGLVRHARRKGKQQSLPGFRHEGYLVISLNPFCQLSPNKSYPRLLELSTPVRSHLHCIDCTDLFMFTGINTRNTCSSSFGTCIVSTATRSYRPLRVSAI